MLLAKILFSKEFEHNGHFFRGVIVRDGVTMEPSDDCNGNPNAFIKFDQGNGVQLLVKNCVVGLSMSEGVPDDFVDLYPAPAPVEV